ncbi:MAG: hypothetical protein WCD08_02730 [Steroidobacteraceae bacterium]
MNEPQCSAACSAQFERCPPMFSAFPERGAIECPAARQQCLRACGRAQNAAAPRVARPPTPPSPPLPPPPPSTPLPIPPPTPAPVPVSVAPPAASQASRESRLRELKHFHDEGLITDDVYRERQTAILTEP